jgi:hypothetical protein
MADLARCAAAAFAFSQDRSELRLGTGVPGRANAWEDPVGQQALAEWKRRLAIFPQSGAIQKTALLPLAGSEEDWLARMKAEVALQPAPGAALWGDDPYCSPGGIP